MLCCLFACASVPDSTQAGPELDAQPHSAIQGAKRAPLCTALTLNGTWNVAPAIGVSAPIDNCPGPKVLSAGAPPHARPTGKLMPDASLAYRSHCAASLRAMQTQRRRAAGRRRLVAFVASSRFRFKSVLEQHACCAFAHLRKGGIGTASHDS